MDDETLKTVIETIREAANRSLGLSHGEPLLRGRGYGLRLAAEFIEDIMVSPSPAGMKVLRQRLLADAEKRPDYRH